MQRTPEEASRAPPKEQSEESRNKEEAQLRKTAMSARCRLALQKSHMELMRDLDVMHTIDFLFSRMVLKLKDKQEIQGKPTDFARRSALLDMLPERGQRAYDQLCKCLSDDQPWLENSLQESYDTITEEELAYFADDLASVEHTSDQREVASTAELAEALRENLKERMNKWKTALEQGFSDQTLQLPYIDQPYSIEIESEQEQPDVYNSLGEGPTRIGKTELLTSEEQSDVSRSIKLIEDSTPGERIILYGGAGMGKTTLLKEVARSWIERKNQILVDKFTFMFLIPLRFVGKGSLLSIICDELKLLSTVNMGELEKSLHRNEKKTILLLDSFDELRLDVIQEETSEIGDLISGRLFPGSTVVVTSRPGCKLGKVGHPKIAQLENLPEDRVKEVIIKHLDEDQDAIDEVLSSFPAMAYLQKPINLALFLFIIRKYQHFTHSRTQAGLFSMMLQYFMLACAKKKKLPEFIPQPGSFLVNKNIPRDIQRLFSVLAKQCYDQRKEVNGVLHVEDPSDLIEYLEFGLFTEGSTSNTVVLPHPLFQEYFTACHLAENPQTWRDLLEEIREKSESQTPKSPLVDIVRPMGLENVVRFVVALSPQVCEELASLFVVERKKIEGCNNYQLVNFEYYAELLRDCHDENVKRVLASAILKAPVVDVTETSSEQMQGSASVSLSSHMIESLEYPQCVNFLKKIHNLNMCEKDGELSVSCTGDGQTLEIRDSFLVALLHKHHCHIITDQLIIGGEKDRHLELPSSMLPNNVTAIRLLKLEYCTLRGDKSDKDMSVAIRDSSPVLHSSLERVHLRGVKGLKHCDVITSRQCHLEMLRCVDVRVRTLMTCFPALSELEFKYGSVVAETGEELMSWLSTVHRVRALGLSHIKGESSSVSRQLSIFAERDELEHLGLLNCALFGSDKEPCFPVRENKTLTELALFGCKGDVDLGQLFEVCRQCVQLKELSVYESQLVVRLRDTSVTQNNTLSKVRLVRCKGDVVLDELFEICAQCLQPRKLIVQSSRLVVRVRDTSDTVKQNNTLSTLVLRECKGDVDLGVLLEACGECLQLTTLHVYTSRLVVRVRDSDTIRRNSTLSELMLSECEGNIDLGEVLEVCGQCMQLKELIVDICQLVFRVRDTSHNIAQNNTLSSLILSGCKGDVDLGVLLEACGQCLQLTTLHVRTSQLVIRVRDTSETVKQNSTLSSLVLSGCKGDVDLGVLLEACGQCMQLKELGVHKCQLVVRVRNTSNPVKPNNTLSSVRLSECEGDIDLGEVFEVCSSCVQLKGLMVDKCQLLVRVENTRQNNTLGELRLIECKSRVDLGKVLEVCSQYLQVKKVWVEQSNLVLDEEKIQSIKQLSGLQQLILDDSSVHTPAGQRLRTEEVNETLSRLCPSASIRISGEDFSVSQPEKLKREDFPVSQPKEPMRADFPGPLPKKSKGLLTRLAARFRRKRDNK